jgi:hypothetical protein
MPMQVEHVTLEPLECVDKRLKSTKPSCLYYEPLDICFDVACQPGPEAMEVIMVHFPGMA